MAQVQDDSADLSVVVAAWIDRKLEVDVPSFAVKQLAKIVKGPNHAQPPQCMVDMLDAVQARHSAIDGKKLLAK